ncbi:hypothetical protein IFJ82_00835 [Novacetimonas hansenii]|uniref:Uncharacterized protein n=2 Tax=Novacetimonas hansenii TaxID=436 RepID=A0AAW5ESV1_NOVHA|nr:hypothetical protein [Novacetimonas hansenii]EFG85790.1 hypothetical protein GXY_00938 [Novacetimonas hansenii ATCC 23769]MBL7237894.1 hypothetical protein [Novacetimonas hansenii]MCJ8354375.1 hypothetical protein [Novacetimonas hansenii]QOF95307.1 hypothetical protein IFJ82_00835 [Novacetimonas hansenii]WEQ58103.1 hypothetical protein LV563_09450 [Novacetimonas hansenii]
MRIPRPRNDTTRQDGDDGPDVPVVSWRVLIGIQVGVTVFILIMAWWDSSLPR